MAFPSLEQVLGLSWAGTWMPGQLYRENNIVESDNQFYACLFTNQGVPLTDTNVWVLLKDHISKSGSLGMSNTATTTKAGNVRSNLAVESGSPIAVTQPLAFTPPPPVSEWTWVNQGTAVAYDDAGTIKFVVEPDDTQQQCVLF